MKFAFGFTLLFLFNCSSGRILTAEERDKHGLHGVMHDARLCPVKQDRVQGPCELVSCLPEGKSYRCVAVPAP